MGKSARERNRALVTEEYAAGAVELRSVPLDLQFGISNACNLSCAFCSDHFPGSQVPVIRYGEAQLNEVRRTVPKLSAAAFHGVGEFFLDPTFEELVTLCSEHGVTLLLNTNGTVFTSKHRRLLSQHRGGLHITISFDAVRPETYRKVRGGDLALVVENARQMLAMLRARSAYSGATAAFVLMRENLDEAVPFMRLASGMGFDHVYFSRLFDLKGEGWRADRSGWPFDYEGQGPWTVPAAHDRVVHELRRLAAELGQDSTIPWYYGQTEAPEVINTRTEFPDPDPEPELQVAPEPETPAAPAPETEPAEPIDFNDAPLPAYGDTSSALCDKPWRGRAVVATNGDLFPCCFMLEPVANMNEAGSFEAVWNAEGMQQLRRELAAGRFPRPCRSSNCPIYQKHRE